MSDVTPDDASAPLEGAQPARAVEPPVRRVVDVVRLSFGTDVARLVSSDPVARLGEDPEGVHQARVATRRLRSHLATYGAVLRPGPSKRLRRELRWLGRSLGSVRDLDVLRERLAEAVKSIDPLARADGLALLHRADLEREAAAEGLESVLTSGRYRSLLEGLGAMVADPPIRSGADQPAEPFLRDAVGVRYVALVDAMGALPPAPLDVQLHAVRIVAKPVRYAAEAAVGILPPPCRRFAKSVTDLCDVLGDLNDGLRVSQWLDVAVSEEPSRAATIARVRTVEIGLMADARGSWPTSWDALRGVAEDMGWEPAGPPAE